VTALSTARLTVHLAGPLCSRVLSLGLAFALAVNRALLPSPTSVAAAPRAAPAGFTVSGTTVVDRVGRPAFLIGANYQGPADRAWQMWTDEQFDLGLISQDFARAKAAGLGVLRIFVQKPLADDLASGRWQKLDRVLDLADRHGLAIILTLNDYTDWDLAQVAALDGAIAARYRGRPTIVALDLKNEPRLGDLALTSYPPGGAPTLQSAGLVARIGERIAREEIPEYRASESGQKSVPVRLDDEQAYVYVNVLRAYLQLLDDSGAWVRSRDGANVVRYLRSPEAAAWTPFLEALNDALALWMRPRLAAIRSADPNRLVTVAHVDTILAVLPVNAWTDYRTYHRYPSATPAGIRAALNLWDDVRKAVPGRPIILGELGISNEGTDEATSAALELEFVRGLRERGGAGALKWMLNDFPNGANAHENSFGMFRGDGTPKPVVGALRAYAQTAPQSAGGTVAAAVLPPPACGPANIANQRLPALSRLMVAGTDGEGAFLRKSPRLDDLLQAWSDGTLLDVLGPDLERDGLRWTPVRDPCGVVGWLPMRYGAPATP
jgi:hypothetical protein